MQYYEENKAVEVLHRNIIQQEGLARNETFPFGTPMARLACS